MVKNILIVDDETSVTYTVKHGLENLDNDYKVTITNNGEQCLEYLAVHEPPDLILLDIMMPGISGWETQKRIKENPAWYNIPVVFLTARVDHVAKQAGSYIGDDYIEKPFKIQELKQRIDKVLKNK